MKYIVSRMSSYFPNRWPLSYLNLTKNMKTYIRRQQHKKILYTKTQNKKNHHRSIDLERSYFNQNCKKIKTNADGDLTVFIPNDDRRWEYFEYSHLCFFRFRFVCKSAKKIVSVANRFAVFSDTPKHR